MDAMTAGPSITGMTPVGTASCDITPPLGALLIGYRDRPSTALGHRLRAEALVVGSGRARWALVTADLLGFSQAVAREARRAIAARTGIPARRVLLTATHTHSGPDAVSPHGAPAWRRTLIARLARLVAAAANGAQPAELLAGSCRAPAWLHNRRVRQADGSVRNEWRDPARRHRGHVDDRVQLLAARRADGWLAALLVAFGCHPVTLGPQSPAISADYPGHLKDALERRGVGTALFAVAGHGDINPPECIRRGERHPRRMGNALARLVAAALPRLRPVVEGRIAVGVAPWRLRGRVTAVTCLRAGDAVIVAVPGELCSELAVAIRAAAGARTHCLALSLGNDYVGYLPTDRMRREGGHEGRCSPGDIERPLRRLAARALRLAVCLLAGLAPLAAAERKPPEPANPYVAGEWAGPERDFRLVEGAVLGPWWQGGGLGVAYLTGEHAQKLAAFEELGTVLAKAMGRPYLEIHKQDLVPNVAAGKGALAYPDGTARVRLLIVPGGHATKNLAEIAGVEIGAKADRARLEQARATPRSAFASGMNYLGVCAGSYTATSGNVDPRSLTFDWCLWPGKTSGIGPGMSKPFPDVVFDPSLQKHPLWQATNKGVLTGMFFNGGPLDLQSDVPDTEYLGTYQGGNMPEIVGKHFAIAYRPAANPASGRLVISTGHPESGHREFLAAMARYALDHEYAVPRRELAPGTAATGLCGEDQVQYWTLAAPEGRKLTVRLTGLDGNCDLLLRRGLPPTFRKSDGKSVKKGTADEQVAVAATKAEDYWIAVCGRHLLPGGAAYTLTAVLE